MKHSLPFDLTATTVGDQNTADGIPRGSTFTSTISLFGVDICTASADTPGGAQAEAQKKLANALKELCS